MASWKSGVFGVVLSCVLVSTGPSFAQLGAAHDGPSFGSVNPEQMARMLNPAEDGPFYMINLIQFREKAVYRDGRQTDLTGEEANSLYSPIDILQEIGAEVVFVAQVQEALLGDETRWDQVAIVRYPSRRAFLQMSQRPDFQARSIHKDAGVSKSIVMVSHLMDPPRPQGSAPTGHIEPSIGGDRPFELIHVLRYREQARHQRGESEEDSSEPTPSGRDATARSGQAAGSLAGPMGVRPTAWFEVEGVFIGDGRPWDQVRIRHFPSQATLEKHLAGEARANAAPHREAAIEDSYTLKTVPALNRLAHQ